MGCILPQAGQRILNPLFFPGLAQWYCAERVQGAGNDAIDLSGNGRTGINNAVTIVAGVANGRPVFRFNGIASQLTYFASTIATTSDFSAFAYLKNTTNVTARTMQCWANSAVNRQVLAGNAANQLGCYDGINNPVSGVVDDYTNFSLCGVICAGTVCTFYQNNVNVGVGALPFTGATINTFGEVLSLVFSTMDVAELVFYLAPLGATQRGQLNEYFRERYNF